MNTLRIFRVGLLTVLVCLGLSGCGLDFDGLFDSRGPIRQDVDLTGTWSGSWTRTDGTTGDLAGVFDQDGSVQGVGGETTLTGSVSLDGFSCPSPLSIDGLVLTGSAASQPLFNGTFTSGFTTIGVSTVVTGLGFIHFSGTYEVLTGSCTGETGTLTGTIVAPLQASDPPPAFVTETVVVYDDLGNVETTRSVKQLERPRD